MRERFVDLSHSRAAKAERFSRVFVIPSMEAQADPESSTDSSPALSRRLGGAGAYPLGCSSGEGHETAHVGWSSCEFAPTRAIGYEYMTSHSSLT